MTIVWKPPDHDILPCGTYIYRDLPDVWPCPTCGGPAPFSIRHGFMLHTFSFRCPNCGNVERKVLAYDPFSIQDARHV